MCETAELALVVDARSVATARRWLAATLVDRYEAGVRTDDAALVVSELVTNALQAGAGAVTVAVEMHRRRVRVAVTDDAEGVPTPGAASDAATTGRGLALVDAVSTGWGTDRASGSARRKTVWADVDAPVAREHFVCSHAA